MSAADNSTMGLSDPASNQDTAVTTTEHILAQKEEKDVKRIRYLIILVVLMSIIGSVSVYFYSKNSEDKVFQQRFYYDGSKVLASLGDTLDKALGGLDNLALAVTTRAQETNQTFPFVAMYDFPIHAARAQSLTKAASTFMVPIQRFDQRAEWERFIARNNSPAPGVPSLLEKYTIETLRLQEGWKGYNGPKQDHYNWSASDCIYLYDGFNPVPNYTKGSRGPGVLDIYMSELYQFPLIMDIYAPSGYDHYSDIYERVHLTRMIQTRQAVLSLPDLIPDPNNATEVAYAEYLCPYFVSFFPPGTPCMEPLSIWYYPIMDRYDEIDMTYKSEPNMTKADLTNGVKGSLNSPFYWRDLFTNILPESSQGMILVTSNACQPKKPFTYQINGPKVKYLGVGDHHQSKHNDLTLTSSMYELHSYSDSESDYNGLLLDTDNCPFAFTLYASDVMKQQYETNTGIIFAVSAAAFVLFPFLIFVVYDHTVSKQQMALMKSANRSNAIVNSLFPSNVRDKLYPKGDSDCNSNDVIAELYADTTVIFVDIANFTVWSSVRDPFQVFTLLESLYGVYDKVADRSKIFKVETVGDSYIAVCGLPTPNKNHAVVMARYAMEIIKETAITMMHLEKRLGPGTGDLMVRVGLNSGPTTAGVLRGAKGRYQVFGDTVNTAARMESNGVPGKIMCTEKTANLLIEAGKSHWVTLRDDLVNAKGKGLLTCYWVNINDHRTEAEAEEPFSNVANVDAAQQRLVGWMTEMFLDLLQNVVMSRKIQDSDFLTAQNEITFLSPREEVTESIDLSAGSSVGKKGVTKQNDSTINPIEPKVKLQMQEYITMISQLYQPNPFHNFEHACHVVMVAKKLLTRILRPTESSASLTAYGITSDPLTQFAIIFSALIHDVDHPGVSNAQLVKEKDPIALKFHDLSVAEQNSITIAWDLLMLPQFHELRRTIMGSEMECRQFRQLVVNSVMATDLFDKDLKALRDNRWNAAFNDTLSSSFTLSEEDSNRRATIVIEHVIQAADVSHTMQHWHIYQKWNKRLLHEMYSAYVNGRLEKDPSVGWYNGELWFFDNYIIPLAKKLKTCGVFGVSCDELLDYAMENRAEWAAKGQQVVEENMLEFNDLAEQSKLETTRKSYSTYIGSAFERVVECSDSIDSTALGNTVLP